MLHNTITTDCNKTNDNSVAQFNCEKVTINQFVATLAFSQSISQFALLKSTKLKQKNLETLLHIKNSQHINQKANFSIQVTQSVNQTKIEKQILPLNQSVSQSVKKVIIS